LSAAFLGALSDDFREHGADAIKTAREKDPMGYVKMLAGILPKEFEITRMDSDISDDELTMMIAAARAALQATEEKLDDKQVH
jgi:hypothetical protein